MLFTPKLSDSFKAIEAFSENKDIAASVIREELIRNILLIIATTIIAGFNVLMRQTLIVMSRHIEFDLKRSFQAV
jgi:ATP-binding cassette subfamily B protein